MLKIMCAVCLKPVESVEWFDDYPTNERVIRVRCHGETDEMRLSNYDIVLYGRQLENAPGVAFSDRRKELLQC